MSLNPSECAAAIYEAYKPAQKQELHSYQADFANSYHDYANAAEIAGAVSGGGDASIIEGFMDGVTSDSSTVNKLAVALASYWGGVGVTPAPPNLSSVNDAQSKVNDFEQAIIDTIINTDTQPYFESLITNTQAVVEKIVWVITPPPPLPPFNSGAL